MSPAKHPIRRVVMIALGVTVALVVLGAALVLKSPQIAGLLRDQVEASASRTFGRPVTIQGFDTRLLPKPGATITSLRVEGEANEPPFLEASRATASVQLWPLLRSLGKDVRLGAVELENPQLNLVRRNDGAWNYESIGKTAESSPGGAERETFVVDLRIRNGVVRVTDQQAPGNPSVVLRDIDANLKNLGPGRALKGTAEAAFTAPRQNVKLDFKVDPLPAGKIQAGQPWPRVTLRLRAEDISVSALRHVLPGTATGYFTGGRVGLQANLTTDQGQYALQGRGSASELRLRGDPARGSFAFNARIDPAAARTATVNFTQVALEGPGIDLRGTASARLSPLRVQFALQGKELDLKHLLGSLPPQPEEEEAATSLPASVRAQLGKIEVGGTLELAKIRHGALVATDVDAQAKLDEGVLLIQRGRATVYGGHADIDGSRVDLTEAQPKWSVKMAFSGIDTAQASQALVGHQALEGKASGELQLAGTGADWARARNDVVGGGRLQLRDGALKVTDLGAGVAPGLAKGLEVLGVPGAAGKVPRSEQGTRLEELNAQFQVGGGWIAFTQPMAFRSDIGAGTLDGRVGLDQRLDLDGTIKASAQFVSAATGGVIPVKAPVAIPFTITGTLEAPVVKPGDPAKIAESLLPAVSLKSVTKPLNQARKGIGNIFRRPHK